MAQDTALILGCGYTGRRVAQQLRDRGWQVIATTTTGDARVAGITGRRVCWPESPEIGEVPAGTRVLYSVPVLGDGRDATRDLLAQLRGKAARVVYLSTTSVYGGQREVDEHTPVSPRTDRERQRVAAEQYVRSGPWSSLVLRPAAIYGPDRGVHVAVRAGRFRLAGVGRNFVSRIHVEDLAAIAAAALASDVEGEYPVADDLPCTSLEIASWCADLYGVALPRSVAVAELHSTRQADRRVNGRAIRRLLGAELRWPDYRAGISALEPD